MHIPTFNRRTDFSNICRRYKLNYKQVMDQIGTDGEGRYSLDAFIHYMKRYHHTQQHSHHQSNQYYDQEPFTRPTSPVHRPSSASKISRQAVYSSASSGHHHTRNSSRYPMSPVGGSGIYNDQDASFTPDDLHLVKRRQEITRTPDVSRLCCLLVYVLSKLSVVGRCVSVIIWV